jgi:phosphatidylglycerophosphatase A
MSKLAPLIKKIFATGCYIGYLPLAPATFACGLSIPAWYFLGPHKAVYIALAFVLFFWGLIASNDLSQTMGKDPRPIVVDEYACFLLPLYFTPRHVLPLAVSFVLFRFFDVVKPYPLRRLEKLPGGWGIMLDDLGAAVYTTVIVIFLKIILKW